MKPINTRILSLVLATASLTGCSMSRPFMAPDVPQTAKIEYSTTLDETDAIETSFIPEDSFLIKGISQTEKLPNVKIPHVYVQENGVYDALYLVARQAKIRLNIEGSASGSRNYGAVAAFGISGDLQNVIETLSKVMGFFYDYNDGLLTIKQNQSFVVQLPPILSDDTYAGINNTIQRLGAQDALLDRQNSSITFTANRRSYEQIAKFLAEYRNSRPMIMYEMDVIQVDLNDQHTSGISWNSISKFADAGAANAASMTYSTTNSVNMVFSGAKYNVSALLNFLNSQGTVKSLMRPRFAVISGEQSNLRDGHDRLYTSRVGTNYSTAVNSVTVETAILNTGIDINLRGVVADGTVQTKIDLSIRDIYDWTEKQYQGLAVQLWDVTTRKMNTINRARSGDLFLIGGIQIQKDSKTQNNGIATVGKTEGVQRSELVLAIRPKVVRFTQRDGKTSVAVMPGVEGAK